MKKVHLQHGDVLIMEMEKSSSIPKDAKKVDFTSNSYIVEKGEGHNLHVITMPTIQELSDKLEVYEKNGQIYFNVKEDIKINHVEHGTKIIRKGIHYKEIERQFDYENEIERRVKD